MHEHNEKFLREGERERLRFYPARFNNSCEKTSNDCSSGRKRKEQGKKNELARQRTITLQRELTERNYHRLANKPEENAQAEH